MLRHRGLVRSLYLTRLTDLTLVLRLVLAKYQSSLWSVIIWSGGGIIELLIVRHALRSGDFFRFCDLLLCSLRLGVR